MTREEEAIKTMQEMLKDCHRKSDALSVAIAALRSPTHDPETGLVRCGCGGRATFHHAYVARDDECCVECTKCGARSALRLGEQRARDSWNTAMGFKGGAE